MTLSEPEIGGKDTVSTPHYIHTFQSNNGYNWKYFSLWERKTLYVRQGNLECSGYQYTNGSCTGQVSLVRAEIVSTLKVGLKIHNK